MTPKTLKGAFRATAERALGRPRPPLNIESTDTTPANIHNGTPVQPTFFAGGRYQVERFLGEGEKKKGYLAHDTTLDREVAFGHNRGRFSNRCWACRVDRSSGVTRLSPDEELRVGSEVYGAAGVAAG